MTEPAVDYHEYAPTVPKVYIALAWLWVVAPFAYGFYQLLLKVGQLFG
ncbi:MFS transporter small subunit [Mycolicibacterium sp. XJ870]